MAKKIYYERTETMQPRQGVSYATTYVKQTVKQRHELERHVNKTIRELGEAIPILAQQDASWIDFIEQPLKGFKTTQGKNRSLLDLLTDMQNESRGTKRNGEPKDFALAPIERWNKLFKDTDYAVDLIKSTDRINFNQIMELVE